VEVYEILDKYNNPTHKLQKILLRLHHLSDKFDYSYVLARESYIVSAWCNSKNDDHRLIESFANYYCPDTLKEIVVMKIQHKSNP
jgi:hypothetical protein